ILLGFAGSLLGVGMARAAIAAIPLALGASSSILAQAHYGVTWSAALQGTGVGVLVSLLFSVVPLLHVRFIKPSLLLRDEKVKRRADWLSIAVLVGVSIALVALTAWQAASIRAGVVVCAGCAALAVVLMLAGRGLIALVSPLANARSFPLRHAVLHLSRPGNQTRVILLAVGLGSFFIVGVRSLQASLLEEFSIQTAANSPDMFLLDIQRRQADAVRAFLGDSAHGAGEFQLIPVLRGRVVGVGGLVLFSGGLILIGAVAMTKFQRVYEAAVFKTLGANTRAIARMLLYEYGVLGSLAGLIGSAGAIVLTWSVSKYALDIPWRIFPTEHVAGVLLTATLVAVIGVLSSLDVLRN